MDGWLSKMKDRWEEKRDRAGERDGLMNPKLFREKKSPSIDIFQPFIIQMEKNTLFQDCRGNLVTLKDHPSDPGVKSQSLWGTADFR